MAWPNGFVRAQEPLANHTSFRIGGPAEWFAEPLTIDELMDVLPAANHAGIPVSIIGGGTNLLVADRGLHGLVVHLGRGFRTTHFLTNGESPDVVIRCGAGLLTQHLVQLASQHGWADLERLAGLPGQLGGAVAMNAQNIGRFVDRITVVSLTGGLQERSREHLRFAYRDAALEPGIIVDVVLRFPKASPEVSAQRIQQALCDRKTTQELSLPSAGCAFKNPPGTSAGRLIDQAGLKGTRIGDAFISRRHANFIVNLGHATCGEVLALMEYVQHCVERRFGVWLEPEIRILGERFG